MKTWITSVGISHHAVVNTLWAAVAEKQWIPERIYILTTDRTGEDTAAISKRMEAIVLQYGGKGPDFRVRTFDETDLEELFRLYTVIIEKETKEGNEISVDITPGRKSMSVFALYGSLTHRENVRNIFYFHLLDDDFMDRFYPFLPVNTFRLRNLMDFKGAIP